MEKSSNIEDQVIDNLLRSYVKQQSAPEVQCQGFDPDLASLYLEQVLAEKEASRYEIHLAKCSPCRSSVVALARFAEQEMPLAISAPVAEPQTVDAATETKPNTVVVSTANWLARVKALLNAFVTPGYALGAVAVLVLAISIPIVISQKGKNGVAPSANTPSTAEAFTGDAPSPIAQGSAPNQGVLAYDDSKDQTAPADSRNSSVAQSTNNSSPSQPGVATGEASGGAVAPTPAAEIATAKENTKAEEKSDATTVAENKPRSDDTAGAGRTSEPSAARAAAPPAPESGSAVANERSKLPRIDPNEALRIPESDKDTPVKTIKPGASDGSVAIANKPKGATIRPGDASSRPPATSTESARSKGVVTEKSKSSYRDESDSRKERARASASRKIDNKTFWLLDDIWTDRDYRKEKELPVVTLIKESDVYREVLEKRSSLQKFFKGFAANEKVIIVYKGTVYKLLPQ